MEKSPASFYEQIILTKRIHYILYWAIIGILFLILEIVIFVVFREPLPSLRLLVAATCGIFGVVIGWTHISRSFFTAYGTIDSVVVLPSKSSDPWVEERYLDLFTFRTWLSKALALLLSAGAVATVIALGPPFSSPWVNLLLLVEIAAFFAICGHGAYFLLGLLAVLAEVVQYPIRPSFYRSSHPAIMALYGYYLNTAIIVLVLYLWLILTLWLSPYGLRSYILVWPTILAFYPLAMFLWAFFKVHTLMERIKQNNIDMINKQVQSILTRLNTQPSKENAEVLAQVMDIQKKVEAMSDWPFSLQGVATFLIALVAPFLQLFQAIQGTLP